MSAPVPVKTCRCGRAYSPTDAPRKLVYVGAYATIRWGEGGYVATLCPACFDREGRRMERAAEARDLGSLESGGCPVCGKVTGCECWLGRKLGEEAARR